MRPVDDEQYRALIEHAPSMVWRVGPSGQHEFFNATWLAFTGRSLQEELGMGWVSSLHPDDVFACLAVQKDHFARREAFEIEFRLRRHDGVYRRVVDRGVPYTNSEGVFAGFIGNCVDIETRAARDESFGVNEFFEMSLDNLCVAGYDGYFKRLNPMWTKTLGWTAAELMSKPLHEFVHPDDQEETLAGRQRLFDGTPLGPYANRYLCRDGSYRWFEWRSVAHGDRRLVYAAARDITEQKQAAERLSEAKRAQEALERRLIFADRMASLGTLAAGVAHEIRNPLASISGSVELLSSDPSTDEDSAALMRIVTREIERLNGLISELLDYANPRAPNLARFDLCEVVRDTLRVFAQTAKFTKVTVEFEDDDGQREIRIEADPEKIRQLIWNLLRNGAEASVQGGHHLWVSVTAQEDAAELIFRDDGPGIPQEVLAHIFDPFFTTKSKGSGLGLATVHGTVSDHAGTITVASEEGQGASFRVRLPYHQDHDA